MAQASFIEETSYFLFLGICLFYFWPVFKTPEVFLTFPVLSGVVWLAYIAPQAFGILYNPIHLSPDIYHHGYAQTMIMCAMCVLFGAWGWNRSMSVKTAPVQRESITNPEALFVAGTIFTIVAWASFLYIAQLTGGIVQYYSVGGNYALDWLGSEVIAAFFVKIFSNVGIVALMFSFVQRPHWLTATVALIAVAPSLGDIIFLNRRSDVIYLALSTLGPAFFVRRWAPSRSAVLLALVGGMFVVFTFPVIRGAFLIGADVSVDVGDAFQTAIFDDVLGGNVHKEFNNSIGIIASSDYTGTFGFGAGVWNSWVQTTVPRSILGPAIKEFLSFEAFSFPEIGMKAFGWIPVWYQSRSVAALLFADFWYFGAIVFLFFGGIFGRVYRVAIAGSTVAQIWYCNIALLLPHWVATGFWKAPRDLLLTFILIKVIELMARSWKKLDAHPAHIGERF